MAAFFPAFFKGYWSFDIDPALSTARLGLGNAAVGVLLAIVSPVFGAVAALHGKKKNYFTTFVLIGALATSMLFFVPKGGWLLALLVFGVARIGFNLSNLFYDAYLVDVADHGRRDLVSSFGYGLGYLGCAILFVVNLQMFSNPGAFGIPNAGIAVRIIFITAAVWWLLFTLPFFFYVKDRGAFSVYKFGDLIKSGFRQTIQTGSVILKNRRLMLFLIAYWFYIDGVHTVVLMATDYGLSIGIGMKELMLSLLAVQLVAFPSAIFFGFLARKIGAVTSIVIAIVIYIVITGGGSWYLENATQFMFFAALTGTAQGAVQALSRSLFSKAIPKNEEASYFGFFNMVGRFAVILGPALVGTINLFFHSMGLDSQIAARLGIASISLLFIFGMVLLLFSRINSLILENGQ